MSESHNPTLVRGEIPTAGLADGIVEVSEGVIIRVAAAENWPGHKPEPDGTILPGLIDIHCHGGGGHTLCTTDTDEALAAARHHREAGTTGVVASLVTAPAGTLLDQIRALAPLVADGQLLGIHLEGPFLSEKRRGAQDPDWLLEPDPALAERFIEAGGGAIKVMTIAPELPRAADVITVLRQAGVTVALGHTDASYDTMRRAIDGLDGTALVTHVANGMAPLHHRAAGPVAAALVAAAAGEATVELIDDGVHVDRGFSHLVFAAAAPGRVALITDAMAAAGMPDGDYQLGPQRVRVAAGVARLAAGESIAGGTSHLLEDVTRAGGTAAAIEAASATPARVLGLSAVRGTLTPGAPADLLVTEAGRVAKIMLNGRWSGTREGR
jgi:N-acetylglucosamine-6-phosphate deacetylase